jgi:hypothetical protein
MPGVLPASRVSQGDESRAEFAVALRFSHSEPASTPSAQKAVPAHLRRRDSRGR